MITQNLSLNLIPSGVPQRINVSQYDKGETIAVTLYNGATPFTLPSGATVYVSGTKADNTGFEYACSTSSGVSFTITDQMTVFAGEVTCELSIYQGNNRLSTINFILNVEKAALSEDTEISQTDIPIIENIPQYVTQAANSADLAHKWATFGAASEQPSASNNAKYWAERAAQTDIGQATTVAYTADTAPYAFRRSTHNAVYDKLVGISWVENQLVQNGNFAAATGWSVDNGSLAVASNVGTVTVTNTSNACIVTQQIPVISGHKYLAIARVKASQGTVDVSMWGGQTTPSVALSNEYKTVYGVFYATNTATGKHFYLRVQGLSSSDAKFYVMNAMFIDLTLQFGTAIADKIYTMEQATAGSGLAWIRQYGFLDGKYIAYNVGQIKSAKPKWRKVVGFNQWDEVAELGNYSASGVPQSVSNQIRSKANSPIKVFPNTEYAFYCAGGRVSQVYWYDENDTFIRNDSNGSARTYVVTSPANARYCRFGLPQAYGTAYNHDVCVNISSSKNGTYEPYTSITYPLGSDELRGVPTLDGNNLVADGDVKTSDGVVNNRFLLLNLGDFNWTYDSANKRIYASYAPIKAVNDSAIANAVCSKYVITSRDNLFNEDKCISISYSGGISWISVRDTYYTNGTDFINNMDGVYLLAEKATPTTSVSTPFTSPQVSLVTEETDTPCGHDSVVVDIPEWMRNQYFDDVRAEASKAELLEQFLDIKVEDKTSGGYARFKRCGNHVECTINSYSVTDGGAGIEVPEQFRTSVAEYGFAFASTESAAVAVTYAPSTNKLTFRNANLTSYATGNMHGSISWYIE